MTAKSNDAAGGTNGATVTPGNSGGASGTSWDSVTVTGTSTLTFDNTHTWDSPLAYEFSTPVTAAMSWLAWSTSFNDDEVWTTFYGYFTTYAGIASSTCCRLRGGGVQAARVFWNTAGQLRIADTTTTNAIAMTTACPTNAFFRVDVHVKVSTGVSDVWLFKTSPDAPIGFHDDHISTSGALYGANPITEFSFGVVSNSSSVGPFWLADLGASNVGIVGPPNMWIPGLTQPRRRFVWPRLLRRQPAPIAVPQPFIPPAVRGRRAVPKPPRLRGWVPVPVVVVTASTWLPAGSRPAPRPVPRVRRVRPGIVPPPPGLVPPAARRRAAPPVRRRRPPALPFQQPPPPLGFVRVRPRLVRPVRLRAAVPLPVVVLAPPTYVPSNGRTHRLLLLGQRHRQPFPAWMTPTESCEVIRPDTGTVTRPGTGTTARPSTGTVTRVSTGVVTRPNTGLVVRPGCH